MSFDGYLSFGGIEIVNAQRTAAYLHNLNPAIPFVRKTDRYDTLNVALGHAAYRSPVLDAADWVEKSPSQAEGGFLYVDYVNPTHDFYGLYPLAIEGISDSTMSATVTESILDGGFVGQERDATRSIRVRGVLFGETDAAVEAGLTWLRNALRRNSCAMHGDGCGYTDLNYFLAKPEVCDPAWSTGYGAGETGAEDGPLSPETSPMNTPDGRFYPEGQQVSWEWVLPYVEGAKVRWGAEKFDGTLFDEHDPVILRRTNYITSPTLQGDVGWHPNAGTVLWGQNGFEGTYARVSPSTPPTVRQNFIPDPSFEHGDPESFGWRASSDIVQVTDGTAPQGTKVATVAANPGGTWLETTLLGPVEAATGVFSWWAYGGPDLSSWTLTVTNGDGVLVFTNSIGGPAAGTWARLTLGGISLKRGYILRLTTTGVDPMRVDGFLCEAQGGGPAGTYFDGDTADGGGYTYDFIGGYSGLSRGVNGANSAIELATWSTNSPYDAIASVYLRSSDASPDVTIALLDETDVVITSVTVQPGMEWTRYAISVTGAGLRMRLTSSNGGFDLMKPLLEGGHTLYDYFDFNTVITDPEYSLYSTPGKYFPMPRIDYIGGFDIQSNVGWRPYLYVLEGLLTSVSHNLAIGSQIPMEYQLRPYARTYHKVSCTVGPRKIRDVPIKTGAAMEIDFILTAANPHAFTTFEELVFDNYFTPDPQIYTDYVQNLAINPSVQEDETGWGIISTASISAVRSATRGVDADYGYRATIGATTPAADVYAYYGRPGNNDIPVVGGEKVYPSIMARSSVTRTMKCEVEFYAPGNVVVGTFSGATVSTPSNIYTLLSAGELTAPATAVRMQVRARGVATNWASTQTLDVDHVSAMTAVHTYFDGASASTLTETYQWLDGDAYDTTSIVVPVLVDDSVLVIDPDLPVLLTPPAPPSIPDIAIDDSQITWRRYFFPISAADVSLWASTIPTLQFFTQGEDVRQLRVRFHPNPFGWEPEQVDPTSYCSEFILSYLPENSILTVTGVSEQAWASVAGSGPIPANHLLYGTGGDPMEWPQLSCNIPYVMTIDVPTALDEDDIAFSLSINRRE